MVGAKTLYRSRCAVLGGVCAGLAEYFALDTVVVRALAVALAVVTAGFAAIVYVALWLILPQAPQQDSVVDVSPESVHSEARGCTVEARAAKRSTFVSPGVSSGIGHIPPTPPRGARAAAVPPSAAQSAPAPAPGAPAAQPAPGMAPGAPAAQPAPGVATGAPAAQSAPGASAAQSAATAGPTAALRAPGSPCAPSAAPGAASSPASAAPAAGAPSAGACPVRDASVRIMLFIGMTLLFAGFSGFFSALVSEVRWWQFWPAMLIIVGIVTLVVPPREGEERGWAVAGGIVALVAGAWLLVFSLGFVSWGSLLTIADNLWPLFFVMAGFFIMAVSVRAPGFALCGGAAFAVFCVLGLAWFALPGDLPQATLQLPGKALVIPNLWM